MTILGVLKAKVKKRETKLKELLEDENQELSDGCAKYSKLSFIVHLYHIKVLWCATDKTFSMILDLLKDVFPHAKLPSPFYESKKMIKRLGLSYDKIYACSNHCMIYWGSPENMNRDKCKKCNTSRYIPDENNVGTNVEIDDQHKRKVKPTKVLRYLEDCEIETRFNRSRHNDDDSEINATSKSAILSKLFPAIGKLVGAIKTLPIPSVEIIQSHRYVLANCEIVDVFREEFRIEVTRMHRGKRNSSKLVEEYVHKHFHDWFKQYVTCQDGANIMPKIQWLERGPNNVVRRFKEYNVHGFKFRTLRKEYELKTQSSGVVMSALTKKFSNGRESVEQSSDDMYYGKLVDIIELNYYGKLNLESSVNFTRLIHTGAKETDEPFILATDARMVYYVDDPIDEDWCVVCHMKSRELYDMVDLDAMNLEELSMEDIPKCEQRLKNIEDLPLVRDDTDGQDQGEPTHDDYESDGDDDDDGSDGDEGILH
ncbi:hypothetical protein CQW23_26229 [Capsicum baccatum]|uniref:DUF4216 domain-containing protein n=1 Tax=Capsicum baccatum TaxID=33114 RepID=A0A2G2VN86_CAPBA|nr:hypothetical protein CQW23_26229 [Capsicum baccatum]